jgi:hypothetical protein
MICETVQLSTSTRKQPVKLQEYRNICNTILDTEIFEKVYIFQISKKDKE